MAEQKIKPTTGIWVENVFYPKAFVGRAGDALPSQEPVPRSLASPQYDDTFPSDSERDPLP